MTQTLQSLCFKYLLPFNLKVVLVWNTHTACRCHGDTWSQFLIWMHTWNQFLFWMQAWIQFLLWMHAWIQFLLWMQAWIQFVMDAYLDSIHVMNLCHGLPTPWFGLNVGYQNFFFYWKPTSRIDAQAAHSHQLSHFLPATEYIQFEGWRAEEGYLEGQWHRASTGTLYGVNIGVGINQKNYVGEASSSFMEVGPGIHKSAHHLIWVFHMVFLWEP